MGLQQLTRRLQIGPLNTPPVAEVSSIQWVCGKRHVCVIAGAREASDAHFAFLIGCKTDGEIHVVAVPLRQTVKRQKWWEDEARAAPL